MENPGKVVFAVELQSCVCKQMSTNIENITYEYYVVELREKNGIEKLKRKAMRGITSVNECHRGMFSFSEF